MGGISVDNFESIRENLRKAIAESLGVDEEMVKLALESEDVIEKRDVQIQSRSTSNNETQIQSTIKVIIEVTDETDTGSVLQTANDVSSFKTELTTSMKKHNISENIGVSEISQPNVEQRKEPNLKP